MNPTQASPIPVLGDQPLPWEFDIVLLASRSGPELKRFRADASELSDVASELWRDGFLRRGFPDFSLEQVLLGVELRLDPRGDRRCASLVVEARNPRGESIRRELGIEVFRDAALRGAAGLISDGRLDASALVYYEVVATSRSVDATVLSGDVMVVESRRPSLRYLRVRLADLLEDARPLGPVSDGHFPVVYTAGALEKAERFSRQGGKAVPPVETGAVLVGWPCSCPDSGELFMVVHDVIEARDADQAVFSLAYTGKTWARIQAILQARQSNPASRDSRILGQCHGHNQTPEPQCAQCLKRETCTRTNLAASSDDRLWSRAVFHRQPWQLCHIFGLDARGGHIQGLYTLRDNQLVERGFHVVPQFHPPVPDVSVREASHKL